MEAKKLQRKLGITEEELEAVKIYQGAKIPRIVLARDGNAYKIMNSLLFPGVDNELSRIFIEEDYNFNPETLLKPEEILKIQEDLYAAMYKYGKQKKEKEKTVRFGRRSSTGEMKIRGEVVQNLSTTKNFEEVLAFKKNVSDYFEIEIEPGAACIDMGEILGEEDKFQEEEILIAPYNKVEISEEEFTEKNMRELGENDIDTDIIGKKLVIKVSPLPSNSKILKRLNRRERKDKEEKLKYLNDENNKKISCNVITKLIEIKKESFEDEEFDTIIEALSEGEMSEEEILNKDQILKLIDPEELEVYFKWKEAYQTVLRYNIRERVNEIEKHNKERQAKKEKKEIYKNIKEDELNKLAEERSDLALKETLKVLEEKENIKPRETKEYMKGS